jgi:predicted transposase YbfD/YdcC
VLTVKDNQERLREDIEGCFVQGLETDFAGMNHSQHEEKCQGHGCEERRIVHTINQPEGIRDQGKWQDLNTITMVIREVQQGQNEPTVDVHYYIGSKVAKASAYARYIRGHWGIENGLHWVLAHVWYSAT